MNQYDHTDFPCRRILEEINDFCPGKLDIVTIVHVDYGQEVIALCFTPLGDTKKRDEISDRMGSKVYGQLYRCPECGYIEDYDGTEVNPKHRNDPAPKDQGIRETSPDFREGKN